MAAAHLPTELLHLAARQGGCLTIAQARASGLDARRLRVLEARGLLLRKTPQVYALPGAEPWRRDVWAAVLQHPGAVASHETAGRLLGLPAMPERVVVTVAAGANPRQIDGIRIHQVGPVPTAQLNITDGLACTNIERTLCDLGSVFSRARLGFVLDDLLTSRRTSLAKVGATLAERRRSGRRGAPVIATLLDERAGRPIPRTRLEAQLDAVLAAAGLVGARAEYPLPTEGELRGFVDRAFPDARLIVEADGRRWHTRTADFARDRQRDRHAARRGWLTIRVSWEELDADPGGVAADLRAVYDQRRAA